MEIKTGNKYLCRIDNSEVKTCIINSISTRARKKMGYYLDSYNINISLIIDGKVYNTSTDDYTIEECKEEKRGYVLLYIEKDNKNNNIINEDFVYILENN